MNKTYIGIIIVITLTGFALYNLSPSTSSKLPEAAQKNKPTANRNKDNEETQVKNTKNDAKDHAKPIESSKNTLDIRIENNLSTASVATRQDYYDFMVSQSPLAILEALNHWLSTKEGKDRVTLELTRKALIYQLHFAKITEEALKLLEALIKDDTKKIDERIFLTSILGPVATAESVEVLLALSESIDTPELINAILSGIREAGDQRWNGEYQTAISSPLEAAWSSTERKGQYSSIANGISKAGTSQGTELLMTSLLDTQLTYDELKISRDEKTSAAFRSLKDFRNPEAIPVLANMLNDEEYENNETAFLLAGNSLAAMGKSQSTAELLNWAVQAPSSRAIWAKKWFAKVRDPSSLTLMKETIDNSAFASNRIKDEVTRAYRRKSG